MDALVEMPASPFLPGTAIQYAWDSTSLGYLKTCPRLYYLVMVEGWAPKDTSVHLRFGAEYHSAIEDYDKAKAAGANHNDAMRLAIYNLLCRTAEWDVDTDTRAGKYKNRRTLLQLVIDYFDFFANDTAETFILENGRAAVELSFKFELGWGPQGAWKSQQLHGAMPPDPQPYLLCGHLDRVVRFNSDLYVLDHKTTTTTPSTYFFDSFNPNNQMTLYTFASQVVYHAPVKGVIIEAAQIKLVEPNTFQRGVTYRTQDQLDEWVNDLGYWLSQAEAFATAAYWPMNDTACDKFGGCMFRGICSKSPQVREKWLAGDFVKLEPQDRWNPLKAR
jgi:hypothetical protein